MLSARRAAPRGASGAPSQQEQAPAARSTDQEHYFAERRYSDNFEDVDVLHLAGHEQPRQPEEKVDDGEAEQAGDGGGEGDRPAIAPTSGRTMESGQQSFYQPRDPTKTPDFKGSRDVGGNVPHESLETPLVYFALKYVLPKSALKAIARFYQFRWSATYPLQKRIPIGRTSRICGKKHTPARVQKFLSELSLTYGEVILLLPYLAIIICGVLYSFAYPSVKISGHMARLPLALAILTCTHNSIVTMLLGMPFERAIFYHKISGRLSFINGVFHTYVAFAFPETAYRSVYRTDNFWHFLYDGPINTSGTCLILLMLGIVITSIPKIRHTIFEVFHYVHVLFTLGMVVCAFYHSGSFVVIFAIVILGGDWFTRKILMACVLYPRSAYIKNMTDSVVEVSFPKTTFDYNAGQYVLLAVPQISWFEWHPFSLSSSPHQDVVTLHIRVRGNWTTQLAALAGKTDTIPILLEGPYGSLGVDLTSERYKMMMLMSGGIGVTPMQSICHQLMHEHESGTRTLKKVWFMWTARDPQILDNMDITTTSLHRHSSRRSLMDDSSIGGSQLFGSEVDSKKEKQEVEVADFEFEGDMFKPAAVCGEHDYHPGGGGDDPYFEDPLDYRTDERPEDAQAGGVAEGQGSVGNGPPASAVAPALKGGGDDDAGGVEGGFPALTPSTTPPPETPKKLTPHRIPSMYGKLMRGMTVRGLISPPARPGDLGGDLDIPETIEAGVVGATSPTAGDFVRSLSIDVGDAADNDDGADVGGALRRKSSASSLAGRALRRMSSKSSVSGLLRRTSSNRSMSGASPSASERLDRSWMHDQQLNYVAAARRMSNDFDSPQAQQERRRSSGNNAFCKMQRRLSNTSVVSVGVSGGSDVGERRLSNFSAQIAQTLLTTIPRDNTPDDDLDDFISLGDVEEEEGGRDDLDGPVGVGRYHADWSMIMEVPTPPGDEEAGVDAAQQQQQQQQQQQTSVSHLVAENLIVTYAQVTGVVTDWWRGLSGAGDDDAAAATRSLPPDSTGPRSLFSGDVPSNSVWGSNSNNAETDADDECDAEVARVVARSLMRGNLQMQASAAAPSAAHLPSSLTASTGEPSSDGSGTSNPSPVRKTAADIGKIDEEGGGCFAPREKLPSTPLDQGASPASTPEGGYQGGMEDGPIFDMGGDEGVEQEEDVLHLELFLTATAQGQRDSMTPFERQGRPDIRGMFLQMKSEAKLKGERRIAVCVCAPQRLVDICKSACAKYSCKEVRFDFHSEVFG